MPEQIKPINNNDDDDDDDDDENDDASSNNDDNNDDDFISKIIGDFGRWQLKLTFFLSLVNIPCTWHIVAPSFFKGETQIWCARNQQFHQFDPILWKNYTQPDGGFCKIYNLTNLNLTNAQQLSDLKHFQPPLELIDCNEWEFEDKAQTWISEFQLLCDRETLMSVIEMMFLGGVAVGGLICGIFSDKYGRKRTLMICLLIQSILGTIIAFIPWYELLLVLRTVLGFVSVSIVFSGFVLTVELVGGNWRTITGISYLFPVSLSYLIITGLAWLLRDWRHLQLAISLPGLLFQFLWWILPESPRWLLATGRNDQVICVLQQAAIVNNRELPVNLDKRLLPAKSSKEIESGRVRDLFNTKKMCVRTLLLFIIWFSVYLNYYGIMLNIGNIGGDLYINTILLAIVEIPAMALSIPILLKRGRRWPFALTMIISGLSCAITIPIDLLTTNLQWIIISFTMLSKFSSSSSNAIMPIFTAELYPTKIRNLGVGASNVPAGIALMLVPYLWTMANLHKSVPMSVVAATGILGGVCVLFLPETGRNLKNNNSSNNKSKKNVNDVEIR